MAILPLELLKLILFPLKLWKNGLLLLIKIIIALILLIRLIFTLLIPIIFFLIMMRCLMRNLKNNYLKRILNLINKKKGEPSTYHLALIDVLHKKEEYKDLDMILHSNQSSVYSSKKFNQFLPLYNIIHSMSKPGTPTENGAMEAING